MSDESIVNANNDFEKDLKVSISIYSISITEPKNEHISDKNPTVFVPPTASLLENIPDNQFYEFYPKPRPFRKFIGKLKVD